MDTSLYLTSRSTITLVDDRHTGVLDVNELIVLFRNLAYKSLYSFIIEVHVTPVIPHHDRIRLSVYNNT